MQIVDTIPYRRRFELSMKADHHPDFSAAMTNVAVLISDFLETADGIRGLKHAINAIGIAGSDTHGDGCLSLRWLW